MTDRQLEFILIPPPVIAAGVGLIVLLLSRRAKAEFFTPTEIAAKVETKVRPKVKKLEREKKKARAELDKKLKKVERDTKNRAEKRERKKGASAASAKKKADEEAAVVAEARVSIKANKPKKSLINRAKKNPLFRGVYDQATKAVREQRRNITKTVKDEAKKLERSGERKINELTKGFPKELRGAAGDLYRSVKAGKIDVPATKKLGERYAKKAMEDIAKDVGADKLAKSIPNIPSGIPVSGIASFVLEGKFTAKAVSKTGQKVVSDEVSRRISDAVGFPIDLPDEFSAEAIKDSVLGVIPTGVGEVIDLALDVAAQAAAGALTAALAGTAIGSVIPGLGTVVGLGVGLAVNALKGPLKDVFGDDPQPHTRKCPTKVRCPKIKKLSALELIPWAAKEYAAVQATVAADQKKSYCGKGSGPECATRLNTLMKSAYYIVFPIPIKTIQGTRGLISPSPEKNTIDVLGKYEVEALLKLYEKAPKTAKLYSANSKKIIDTPLLQVTEILGRLKKRQREIEKLLSGSANIETAVSALSTIRFAIVTELKSATVQVYFNESRDTKKWLEELAVLFKRLEARDMAINQGIIDRMHEDQKREAELRAQGKTGVVTNII